MDHPIEQTPASDWRPSEELRVLSHDLRGNLGTLKSTLFVVERKTAGGEVDLSRLMDRAGRSLDRCEALLDELIDQHRRELSRG